MSDDEDPHSRATNSSPQASHETRPKSGPVSWLKDLVRGRASNSNNLQEALEDYIDELKETDEDSAIAENQKIFITNVIKTHDLRVSDVMVPRADIVALDEKSDNEQLKKIFEQDQFSRIPVYSESLDHVTGVLYIKDILTHLLDNKPFTLSDIAREPMIVSPGMPLMDLFVTMREDKRHMALIVDEHGGIDGLVTMNDIIEAIVGDIEDEFDNDNEPDIIERPDGSLLADARMDIEDFEERYGYILTSEEREDIDTIGGLAIELAGRVPKRGEIIKHSSGMILEVIEADARRVNRLRLRNLPHIPINDEV